jgi:hypothetical protein
LREMRGAPLAEADYYMAGLTPDTDAIGTSCSI